MTALSEPNMPLAPSTPESAMISSVPALGYRLIEQKIINGSLHFLE